MRRTGALAIVAFLLLITTVPSAAHADVASVAVDRQSYVSELPAGDRCAGTQDICVSAAGASPTARAFVHLDVEALPVGASITELVLTLVPDAGNSAGNAGVDAPTLQACVLTEPLPADPQAQGAPEHDCARASASGEVQDDGSWLFDLTALALVWERSTNTGAAIVPAPAESSPSAQTWSVAFLTTATKATATYSAPTGAPPPGAAAPPRPAPQLPPPLLAAPQEPPAPRIAETHELIPDPLPQIASGVVSAEPRVRGVIVVRTLWLMAALAMAMLAFGMLVGATVRNLRATNGSLRAADVLRGLADARSQTAVAVGLLAVAAIVAVGAAGHSAIIPIGVGP